MRTIRPWSPRARAGILLALAWLPLVRSAEPVPSLAQSGPGRFEVAAVDASIGHVLTAAADEAWRMLAVPLALPESFPSPVFVRVVGENDAMGTPFHVTVEPGGIVSVRLRWTGTLTPAARRALVQGLLMRLAVAHHGVSARLVAPLWLEHACVVLWQTRAEAAQLDAVKQESQRLSPPALAALLAWQRGADEPRPLVVGSFWLATVLQTESGRAREWGSFLLRILGGDPAEQVLATSFAEKFSNPDERELWWQTGWHQAIRVRSLPALDAADSRAQLAALARFVFIGRNEETDAIAPLVDVMVRAAEPVVAAELQRRAAELARLVPALHPFYRNAGLSLAAAFTARKGGDNARVESALAFESDWRDATELEAASAAALDALERRAR